MTSLDSLASVISEVNGPLRDWFSPAKRPLREIDEVMNYRFPFGVWYRGQQDESWPLTPGVFRGKRDSSGIAYHEETSMYYHFKLRTEPAEVARMSSPTDWLALMQHYGLPTRLLDWSESVLVALYFAVKDDDGASSKDGALFVLDPRRLNHFSDLCDRTEAGIHVEQSFDVVLRAEMATNRCWNGLLKEMSIRARMTGDTPTEGKLSVLINRPVKKAKMKHAIQEFANEPPGEDSFFRLTLPTAYYPSRTNRRLISQQSMFTIHGGKVYTRHTGTKGERLPAPIDCLYSHSESLASDSQYVRKYKIPIRAKKTIRNELEAIGIHEGALFPDHEKQAIYVKGLWRID